VILQLAGETVKKITLAPVLLPFLVLFLMTSRKNYIFADVDRWAEVLEGRGPDDAWSRLCAFYRHMVFHPEFRSLFYYRVRAASVLSFLLRPMPTLFIHTRDIGPGLFIQHGFATIITAQKIGKNCWINQQVTIGYSDNRDAPVIGDNVTINAGAIVIGGIAIGDGAKVGAGAVVIRDVMPNTVVVGVPARAIRTGAPFSPPQD
jgi:serine O-acetyltransferase